MAGLRGLYNSHRRNWASRESRVWISTSIRGKELLRKHGVETLEGIVAGGRERQAAEQFGGTVAVKAQVLTGGRGKAGGIKVVDSPEEAEAAAADPWHGHKGPHRQAPAYRGGG